MCAKLFMTVVVPAPEEPVTAMMGCLIDIRFFFRKKRLSHAPARSQPRLGSEQRTLVEQRRAKRPVGPAAPLGVIALDALDLIARAENQRDALMQRLGLKLHQTLATGRGAAAGLLDEQADRIGLVKQPQAPGLAA